MQVMVAAVLVLLTGCQGYDDHDYSAAEALQLGPLPGSAITQGGFVEPYRVEFLLPNDEWRDYIARYYPVDKISEFPVESPGAHPMICTTDFRAGVRLVRHIAGGEIPYLDTGEMTSRSVSAMPNCKPGWAFIEWNLEDPFDPYK